MMHELMTFLDSGHAATQALLDHFAKKVPHSKQEVFRSCLRTVAESVAGHGGVKQWRLKGTFANNTSRNSLV